MTYREAKKVKCGSKLLRKSQNYKPTSVLEIIEDKDTHAIFSVVRMGYSTMMLCVCQCQQKSWLTYT